MGEWRGKALARQQWRGKALAKQLSMTENYLIFTSILS